MDSRPIQRELYGLIMVVVVSVSSVAGAQPNPPSGDPAFETVKAWVAAWSASCSSEVQWRIQNSVLDARGGGTEHSFVTIEHTQYRWPDRFVRRAVLAPGQELPRELMSGQVPYVGTEAILADGRRVRLAADGHGYESLGVRSLRDAALDHIGRSPFIVAHLAASVPADEWIVTSDVAAESQSIRVQLPSLRLRFDLSGSASGSNLPALTSVARLGRDNTVLLQWLFDEPRSLPGLPGPVGTKRRLVHAGEGGSSPGLPAELMVLRSLPDLADSVFDIDLSDATYVHPASGAMFDAHGQQVGTMRLPGHERGWLLTASLAAIGAVVAIAGVWLWWRASRHASGIR